MIELEDSIHIHAGPYILPILGKEELSDELDSNDYNNFMLYVWLCNCFELTLSWLLQQKMLICDLLTYTKFWILVSGLLTWSSIFVVFFDLV